MDGGQTRRVVLGDLPLAEKERFYEFLVSNKVEFVADQSGESFVATIRVVPPVPENARITGRQRQPLTGRMRKGPDQRAKQRSQSQGAKERGPVTDTAATLKAAQSVLRRRYTRFCNLLPSLTAPPKALRANAIIRFADEVYESRYEKDAQFIRTQASGQDIKLPQTFPEFVYEFCAKRYGLKQLVSNNCWGMVSSVELIRGQHVGVDLFGRFLEESYDTTDLLFFLFMRSSVEKVIAQAKKGQAQDSEDESDKEKKQDSQSSKRAMAKANREKEEKKEKEPKEIRLDAKQCIMVVRQSIESKRQELRDNILRKIDGAMAARTENSSRKAPTIEPERLMAIATEEYHNSRDPGGIAGRDGANSGALSLDGTPMSNLPKDKDLDPAIRKEVKQVTQRLIASLSAQGETEINQQQVYEWALQVTLRRHKLGDFLDQDPSHMADAFMGQMGRATSENFGGGGGGQKAFLPSYEDVLNLPPEEFERNLEANVRQLLLAATSDLVSEAVDDLPITQGRVWKDERNIQSLRQALISEFAPTADIIMEAIVSKDFQTWLRTLKIDGGGTSRHRQIFQRLHDEFQEVLTAEITAEAVLQICRGVVSADELKEQVRSRAMELSKGASGNDQRSEDED